MQLQKRTPKTSKSVVRILISALCACTHVVHLHKLKRTCFHHPCMLLQDEQLFQLDSSDFRNSGSAKTFLPEISQTFRR